MTNCAINPIEFKNPSANSTTVQEYVRALLARQQALDVLESIHFQINQVWTTVRRLLEGTGSAARAMQAAQAQLSYRSLEQRREECIASLQEAERRANAALRRMMTGTTAKPARKSAAAKSHLPRTQRKFKQSLAVAC